MKWYDAYFLFFSAVALGMAGGGFLGMIERSPICAFISLIMGMPMSVAVLFEMRAFKSRHNLP